MESEDCSAASIRLESIRELRDVAGSAAHAPGLRRPESYPAPMVDHAAERAEALLRSTLFSTAGKLRMAAEVFLPRKDGDEDESIGQFVRRRFGDEAAAYLADPLLAESGLVTTERVGNQKHYQANSSSPVFAELSGLVRKTVGLVAPLQAALAPLADRITAAFVYGSIAKGTDKAGSDIDLMVIADELEYGTLFAALQAAEAALARTINPNVMSRTEWKRKRAEKDGFAARIATQPHLMVLGSEDELG